MKKGIIIFSLLLNSIFLSQNKGTLTLSEIMFYPSETNGEFVEIYNSSKDLAVNLNNYTIIYSTSTADAIVDFGMGLVLPPKRYALILENDYDFSNGMYLSLVTDSTLVLTIDNGKFGSSGMANTSDRYVYLLNELGDTVDSHKYVADNKSGYSDEIIDLSIVGDSSNWGNSLIINGTPGYKSSLSPKEFDLTIDSLIIQPEEIFSGNEVEFSLNIKNLGLSDASNFAVDLFIDYNNDSLSQASEILLNRSISDLKSGDSLKINTSHTIEKEGGFNVFAEVIYEQDENMENNFYVSQLLVRPIPNDFGDIVINEIMYAPKDEEPEWVELFNRTDTEINLRGWRFADKTSSPTITDEEKIIEANGYIVLSESEILNDYYNIPTEIIVMNLPSLNNTGDKLKLINSWNQIIDSVEYNSNWGGENENSLERISTDVESNDSSNWKSSINKNSATPGLINSVSKKDYDFAVSEIILNPDKPKFGESVSISAEVKNIGKLDTSFSVMLFEDINKDSTNIELIETSGLLILSSDDSTNIEFLFAIESLTRERKFIVEVVAQYDQEESNNKLSKSVSPGFNPESIIINEIMYSPINGEPEWVELFNTTEDSICISRFTLTDILTTPKQTEILTSEFIRSNDYLVISKDSLIWDYHTSINSPTVISRFANLNNDLDGVVLKDSFGETIDSVKYRYKWGGTNGFSLERIMNVNSSTDSTNWKTSKDIELSTPGRKNSVTPFQYDLTIAELMFNPERPTLGDDVYVGAKIKNIGLNEAQECSVIFNYGESNSTILLDEIEINNLTKGDSITVFIGSSFTIHDSVKIDVLLSFANDQDLTNNEKDTTIHSGAKRNTVLINEFMANPNTDEAEWIELYNNTDKSIDIAKWFVSDLYTTPKLSMISNEPVIVEAKSFIVLSNDTSKIDFSETKVVEAKFGTLGNTEDGIILYDFNKKVVDSLKYNADWQIQKGRSLERESFLTETDLQSNWLPSLSQTGSSPGLSNSILETTQASQNSILINEIMYDPSVGNSEFVELFNNAENEVDIGGWHLIINGLDFFEISSTFLKLNSGEYFVVSSDSSILRNYEIDNVENLKILESTSLSLSNAGESIVVIDHWGNVIDSVFYSPKWNNRNIATTKNKSLERISSKLDTNEPTNWSTSLNSSGATPLIINSIFTKNENVTNGISFSPNPFSPDNDGFEDYSIINFSIPFNTAQIRVKIFDDEGRLVRTLINNKAVANKGSILFDGLHDNRNPLHIGMYIVFLEAVDINSGKNISFKDVIVVARKL